jgi:hypothetical protein
MTPLSQLLHQMLLPVNVGHAGPVSTASTCVVGELLIEEK